MNVLLAMEGATGHVQTLLVASPVPVQMVMYWIQMAVLVMVSALTFSQCMMIYIHCMHILRRDFVFSPLVP